MVFFDEILLLHENLIDFGLVFLENGKYMDGPPFPDNKDTLDLRHLQ